LRVAEAIVARQHALLEEGEHAAAPLTLKDIGADVGLHESTISRVTRRKYAVTPRGIMELKAFFRQSVDGVHTPDTIQRRIAELVASENPARPLSDQKISDILAREGIDVARRTIAKYRGELGIPGRSQRRKSS
ncbi:MAG: RNA polymerase factor sigma-54, partial [Candidatus Dadabacteria bacterium]